LIIYERCGHQKLAKGTSLVARSSEPLNLPLEHRAIMAPCCNQM
jgi:hypothetical protein